MKTINNKKKNLLGVCTSICVIYSGVYARNDDGE